MGHDADWVRGPWLRGLPTRPEGKRGTSHGL